MRVRFSVLDPRTSQPRDIGVECDPEHTVGDVLELVSAAMSLTGGLAPGFDRMTSMADSPLREGVVLGARRDDRGSGPVLRVVSGPDAGAALPLTGDWQTVGRDPGSALRLRDKDVSRIHASVRWHDGRLRVRDEDSSNHTRISVSGAFDRAEKIPAGTPVMVPAGEFVQVGGTRLAIEDATGVPAILRPDGAGRLLLNRAPRHRIPAPDAAIILPQPPPAADPGRVSMLLMVLPSLVTLAPGVFLSARFGGALFIVFSLVAAVLMTGGMWWMQRRSDRLRRRRLEADHRARIAAARRTGYRHLDDEDAFLRVEWPDPERVVRIGRDRTSELWGRLPTDDDWLRIRLGTADRPSSLRVDGPIPDQEWNPFTVTAAPHGVDLADAGALGMVGPAEATTDSLAWVLIQTAVLHGPDLRIAIVAPGARGLGWARWLPHVRDGSEILAAWTDEAITPLVEQLTPKDAEPHGYTTVRPHTLVVLVGTTELTKRGDVADLLARGGPAGLRFLCVDNDRAGLPAQCTAVLDVSGGRLAVSGFPELTVTPDRITVAQAESVARSLAPLALVGTGATAGFPDVVRLADILPDTAPESLATAWESGRERTLVTVGLSPGGPVRVDLAAFQGGAHGPHGVVVGYTGSGKSEFVSSLITGLAAANSPQDLNFLFIDYKGGATFTVLSELPHAIGTQTNLHGSPERLLGWLEAEILRRQRVFEATRTKSIEEYRTLRAGDPRREGIARLIVGVDEFGVLITKERKASERLGEITRVGRTVGVHLLLATQSARDIDATITGNAPLRVCLRVQSEAESSQVLGGRSVAATMPPGRQGRAFMVCDNQLWQVQPAWAGAPSGPGHKLPPRAVPLHWDDTNLPERPKTEDSDHIRTDLHDVVERMRAAARISGHVPPARLWHPELPPVVALGERRAREGRVPLGVVDVPSRQQQGDLDLVLGGGSVLIAGGPGSGRTTALRTLAAAAARDGGIALYVVDSENAFTELGRLSQCGAVIPAGEDWRVARLLLRLSALIEERKRLLAQRGFATLSDWHAAAAVDAPAHVLVLIDGLAAVVARLPVLAAILADGHRVGVTACLAARDTEIGSQLAAAFSHHFCLRVPRERTATTLGIQKSAAALSLPLGRALRAPDGDEVQFAVLSVDATDERAAFRAVVDELAGRQDACRAPFRVEPLPVTLPLDASLLDSAPPGAQAVLFGLAGDDALPYWVNPKEASGLITVAGPHGSGRSTAVCAMAVGLARAGRKVVLVRGKKVSVHEVAAGEGIDLVEAGRLPELIAAGIDVVVLDDVAPHRIPDTVLALLSDVDGPLLIGSADVERMGSFPGNSLHKVLAAAEVGIVLSPPQGTFFRMVFDRQDLFSFPSGRGYFFANGERVIGQVPLPR